MVTAKVDFGIDLGITNSAIAVWKGLGVHVFKNNEGFEITPSAVWIDKYNQIQVGRRAKERLDIDPDNAKAEFKLQMGTDVEYLFTQSGRCMKPEELSAEVLKSLKADVMMHTGEDVQAAIITVPAAFELPQCQATNEAARLAGITSSWLVQEPVAVALAHGFQSQRENAFWMIYDLSSGTFDATVINLRVGIIQIVSYGGDNQLGGNLIDWAIVEQLLIPAVTREHPLTDFRRGNPKRNTAIAKLKLAVEHAKLQASRDELAEIIIDVLCHDNSDNTVTFEYELRRADVERIAEPFIRHSINISRKVLAESRLDVGDLEKIILVGDLTLMPYVRECLADRKEGFGIPMDISIDPLTVKARGAAVFAGIKTLESIDQNISVSSTSIQPTRALSVFLCHSSGDKQAVRNLHKRLLTDGINPWLDEENLLAGQEWEQEIPKAVRESDIVIICLSQSAINKKGYVQKEIKYALDVADEQPERTIFLIPIKLEECQIPERLRRWHCVDLFKENGYDRLMRALRSRANELGINISA